MQLFCHQKINLPHKNGLPLFHHPSYKSPRTAVYGPHRVHRTYKLFSPPFNQMYFTDSKSEKKNPEEKKPK
jgi:hypothetical protein